MASLETPDEYVQQLGVGGEWPLTGVRGIMSVFRNDKNIVTY